MTPLSHSPTMRHFEVAGRTQCLYCLHHGGIAAPCAWWIPAANAVRVTTQLKKSCPVSAVSHAGGAVAGVLEAPRTCIHAPPSFSICSFLRDGEPPTDVGLLA